MTIPDLCNNIPEFGNIVPNEQWPKEDIQAYLFSITQAYGAAGLRSPYDGRHHYVPGFEDERKHSFQVSLEAHTLGRVEARFRAELHGGSTVLEGLIEAKDYELLDTRAQRSRGNRKRDRFLLTPGEEGSLAYLTHFIMEACQEDGLFKQVERKKQLLRSPRAGS